MQPQKTEGRKCGPCTACCKPFSIPEIGKLDGGWCKHSIKGKGCGIYKDRPQACHLFTCAWLYGALPEADRPDKVGFFMSVREPVELNGKVIPHFSFYEVWPGGLDTDYAHEYMQGNIDGGNIVSACRMVGKDKYSSVTTFSRHYSPQEAGMIRTALGRDSPRASP